MSARRAVGGGAAWATAAVTAAVCIWLAARTGGVGLLAAIAAGGAARIGWSWFRGGRAASPRRQVWRVLVAMVTVLAVWDTVTLVGEVSTDDGGPLSQRVATWGRDHGLGMFVDELEAWWYDEPPSVEPADELAIATSLPATTTTVDDTVPPVDSTSTTSTTEPEPVPEPPAALVPLFTEPLPGEGQWAPVAVAGGHDAMWATGFRPLADVGGVVATMVVIDQTSVRAALFNGSEQPGGTWARGDRVPPELWPALVAAMNGGFRFDHFKGGYVTEGITVRPLRDGDATIAIGRDGRMTIGVYGRDLVDDGSWSSLRQNLIPIVDAHQSQVRIGIQQGVWWGADHGDEVYVPRSAVCELDDGRIAYAYVSSVDAYQLADSLVSMGCRIAVQLDINGTWPLFYTYGHAPDGTVTRQLVDRRMRDSKNRYLTGTEKDFFAFFDAELVPDPSPLDR